MRGAIDHWAPRFIAMGVDYNDFVRTTGRIERWEDWLDAAFEPRIRAGAGISGPYNFGELWDDLPSLTRDAFTVKSGARNDRDGRERAHALDLAGVLGGLRQPALYVTGGLDRIVPWRQTERAARETPNGVFVLYERGTHVCSNIPYRYRPLVADWLRDQLGGSRD